MSWSSERKIELPDWLKPRPPKVVPPPETRALQIAHYDMLFPRVLDNICKGDTLAKAIRELPIPDIDSGAFFRWMKADPKRYDLYKEAKLVAAEVYAGRMVDIAEGIGPDGDAKTIPDDVQRARLNFDIYKWLTERYNRKDYGDVKTLEVDGQISITAALAEANSRVQPIINATAVEILDEPSQLVLPSASPTSESEDDDA